LVTVGIEIAFARHVNSPLTIRDAALIPFVPLEQYWFLYALLGCQIAALIVYPRKWALIPLTFLGLVLVEILGGGWIVVRSFLYLPFVVLGIFGKSALEELSRAPRRLQALVAALAWAAFAALWANGINNSLLLAVTGSVGTIACAMIAGTSPVLASLGRASLAVYLLHTIFSAGARIGLSMAGFRPTTLVSVISSMIAGVALPYAIWWWARRYKRTSLLGLGA
jgi:hypothetical protein